jgi:Spy/CpxP family protein refolding chaperone
MNPNAATAALTVAASVPAHASETYDPHWLAKKMRKTCFGGNKNRPGVAPWERRKLIADGKKIIEDLKAEKEAKAQAEQTEEKPTQTALVIDDSPTAA